MFRAMRRKNQQLSLAECEEILRRGTSGVLALAGDGGYPYAVPISYAGGAEKLYFHCARQGHKLDAIRRCAKASLCVSGADDVAPEKYKTRYRSVIAFGTVRILESDAERRAAAEALAEKYAPKEPQASREAEIARYWDTLCALEMTVEHLTGKEGLELTLAREAAGGRE